MDGEGAQGEARDRSEGLRTFFPVDDFRVGCLPVAAIPADLALAGGDHVEDPLGAGKGHRDHEAIGCCRDRNRESVFLARAPAAISDHGPDGEEAPPGEVPQHRTAADDQAPEHLPATRRPDGHGLLDMHCGHASSLGPVASVRIPATM